VAEFRMTTTAPEVVILVSDKLDGGRGCYATLTTADLVVWVANRKPADWRRGASDACAVDARRDGGEIVVTITPKTLSGLNWVYAQPRPGGEWRRAAMWYVDDGPPMLEALPWWKLSFPDTLPAGTPDSQVTLTPK
jgi:hypothetical protein